MNYKKLRKYSTRRWGHRINRKYKGTSNNRRKIQSRVKKSFSRFKRHF